MLKNLDIKSWFILILGLLLCVSVWIGQKNHIDGKQEAIDLLHESNKTLAASNDSLNKLNGTLDKQIADKLAIIEINNGKIIETQTKIDSLKNEKNKIAISVRHMSANDISRSFSNYLDKRTAKSKRSNTK